jgi:hypothetical protein
VVVIVEKHRFSNLDIEILAIRKRLDHAEVNGTATVVTVLFALIVWLRCMHASVEPNSDVEPFSQGLTSCTSFELSTTKIVNMPRKVIVGSLHVRMCIQGIFESNPAGICDFA